MEMCDKYLNYDTPINFRNILTMLSNHILYRFPYEHYRSSMLNMISKMRQLAKNFLKPHPTPTPSVSDFPLKLF